MLVEVYSFELPGMDLSDAHDPDYPVRDTAATFLASNVAPPLCSVDTIDIK